MSTILGDRLREMRNAKGLTQDQVAKLLNVSRPGYTRYESGTNSPSIENLSLLADIFDCSADYLLGRVDKPYFIKKELPTENGKKLEVVYDKNRPELKDEEYLRKLIAEELQKQRDRE